MHPALRHMIALSELDSELRRLRERKAAASQQLRRAEERLAEANSALGSHQKEAKRLQREADALNLEVKSAEVEIARLEGQLRGAKSNKEYDILRRELEAAKGKKDQLENAVLERLLEADRIAAEEASARARIEEAQREVQAARESAERVEQEVSSEERALKARRGEFATKLEPEELRLYERLLEQRGDSAIARVSDGFCSACSCRLTPQMGNLLDLGSEIVQCMSCRRILYQEDSGASGP